MKKLALTITLALLAPPLLWAAEEGDAPASPPVTGEANEQRVMPSAQQTRINGLIERLSTNRAHEIETIEANGESFLGLFEESASGDPQGCLLMLHNDHGHPDWPQVISPLRHSLPEHSWCTLSIEIPDVEDRAALTTPEVANLDGDNTSVALPNEETVFARINAAQQRIREKGYNQVAYLGYRTGAAYALRYAAENNISGQALILIEPRTIAPMTDFQFSQEIRRLRLSVLDYYFDRTYRAHQFARMRESAANKRTVRNQNYVQINAVPDARYDATGDKRLEQRVWGFLKQNTVQRNQRKELPEFEKSLFFDSPLD